jgi:nicotinamidase-related amidase
MTSVVDIRAFLASGASPTLVLLDLQQEYLAGARMLRLDDCTRALRNCRDALAHARRMGFPVAFVRWIGRSAFFSSATASCRWIERFEPRGSDMVFERNKPSCFSSALFAEVMAMSGGPIVLAGFSGEAACLSTAIDAFHRGHDFIFLTDASASHAVGDASADDVHAILTRIIRLYGAVADTEGWVRSTLTTKFHE